MRIVKSLSWAVVFFVFTAAYARSAEPEFCTTQGLLEREISLASQGLKRAHGFQLGPTLLIGLAVGDSKNEAIQALPSGAACTWYFGHHDSESQNLYHWRYVSRPDNEDDIGDLRVEYLAALEWMLSEQSSAFWPCIEVRGALTLGCDGQRHRGPTVFAMLLSFLGCAPENSVNIVNDIWDKNGIPVSNRLALAQEAFEFGERYPLLRYRALRRFVP